MAVIVKNPKQAPRYDNSKEVPHEDDAGEPEVPEAAFEAREGELLPDILRRVGGLAKAARRLWQAMDAKTPQGWPDYRNRITAACEVRDTCHGTPDKAKAPAKEAEGDKLPPGVLRDGKGKSKG